MNRKELLQLADHTLLSQQATEREILALCDDAVRFDTASVCIPPSYVKQAKEYIYKHLHEEIFIKDMAKALGISAEYLSRTFHKAEGITLKQYILDERIERAKNLLRFSDRSVSEIARYLAFSSSSHFADVFRKKTGKNPVRYRQDFSDAYIKRL